MNKRKPSSASSKRIRRPSKESLGNNIIAGFAEAIAHNRGEIQLRSRRFYVFDDVDVKAIREKQGLSQSEFAALYGFNTRTLQQWEQGRAKPETAVLAYMRVIDKDPDGVRAALMA